MIYSDKYIVYAIELRTLMTVYKGSLCIVKGRIGKALKYFNIEPWNNYYTNPFMELPSDLISQMDKSMLRLFNSYIEILDPPFTNREISDIISQCKKYNYQVVNYRNRISIRGY